MSDIRPLTVPISLDFQILECFEMSCKPTRNPPTHRHGKHCHPMSSSFRDLFPNNLQAWGSNLLTLGWPVSCARPCGRCPARCPAVARPVAGPVARTVARLFPQIDNEIQPSVTLTDLTIRHMVRSDHLSHDQIYLSHGQI